VFVDGTMTPIRFLVPITGSLRSLVVPPLGRAFPDVYDFRDVCVNTVPTCGRSAVLPHCGQATPPLSCWLMVIGIVTSRLHFSQKYS